MPYDAGKPLVEFAEIPSTDGILEPPFNEDLILLQILGTWGLTRFVLWYCSPSNANGPVIWTTNIPAFLSNCLKVYLGRWGQHLANPWLSAPVVFSFSWHRGVLLSGKRSNILIFMHLT